MDSERKNTPKELSAKFWAGFDRIGDKILNNGAWDAFDRHIGDRLIDNKAWDMFDRAADRVGKMPSRLKRAIGAATVGALLAGGGIAYEVHKPTPVELVQVVDSPDKYVGDRIEVTGFAEHKSTELSKQRGTYYVTVGKVLVAKHYEQGVAESTYDLHVLGNGGGGSIRVVDTEEGTHSHPNPDVIEYTGQVDVTGTLVAQQDSQGDQEYVLQTSHIEQVQPPAN